VINFRYHIVSLMAVFLALAVGIGVGVALAPSVSQGLNAEAEQDRRQVVELRSEVDRLNALNAYRDEYAKRVARPVTAGALSGVGVAVVAMPDAPAAVVQSVVDAVGDAGGSVVRRTKVDGDVFDPTRAQQVETALAPYDDDLGLDDDMTAATRVGRALSYAVAVKSDAERDQQATQVGRALDSAGLVDLGDGSGRGAELVVVVTAVTSDPQPAPELLQAHVQLDVALTVHAGGVVVAGPNSEGVDGTDVATLRSDADAARAVSTVDVADLSSGITTTVLAGQERLLGRVGHYGAMSRADAPLPTLPIR